MEEGVPSRTAYGVALRRAAHQLLDRPLVLEDPVALAIVGPRGLEAIRARAGRFQGPGGRGLRASLVARSRCAEDALARVVAEGTRQYVVLGAGLDTFACRNPHAAAGLRVFEADHPATQAWKRRLLEQAAIQIPPELTFVPVDFERQSLPDALGAAGFEPREPAFCSWLGVTMYLSREAVLHTLAFVASLAPGSGIAFDYTVPPGSLPFLERLRNHALRSRVARAGEPWRTDFEPADLHRELGALGFTRIEDLAGPELNARYFADRADGLKLGRAAHVLVAWR